VISSHHDPVDPAVGRHRALLLLMAGTSYFSVIAMG